MKQFYLMRASTGASGYQFSYNGAPIEHSHQIQQLRLMDFSDGEKFSVTVSENADGSGCTSTATVTIRSQFLWAYIL